MVYLQILRLQIHVLKSSHSLTNPVQSNTQALFLQLACHVTGTIVIAVDKPRVKTKDLSILKN